MARSIDKQAGKLSYTRCVGPMLAPLDFGGSDGARGLIRGRVETSNQNARIASRRILTHELPPVNPSGLFSSLALPSEAGLQFDLFFLFLCLAN